MLCNIVLVSGIKTETFFKNLFLFLAAPRGLRDLSSPTRDGTHMPCIRQILNHGPPRKSLPITFKGNRFPTSPSPRFVWSRGLGINVLAAPQIARVENH